MQVKEYALYKGEELLDPRKHAPVRLRGRERA